MTTTGNGDARITLISLSKKVYYCFNLLTSYMEMLALTFFIFSTILYSMVSDTVIVLDEEGDLEVVGTKSEDGVEVFLTIDLSLVGGTWNFYFLFDADVSASPLLLVLTGRASSSSSFSEVVRIKSHKR